MNLKRRIGELSRQTADLLANQACRLVTVESCTGGGIGYFCTAEPGASVWYRGGYITYDNEEKIRLGVPSPLLEKYGAVSTECAEAMADAAFVKHPECHILAVTGIAGPEGGSSQKPVGTVYFCWLNPFRKKNAHHVFSGDRETVRLQAIAYALEGLIRLMKE